VDPEEAFNKRAEQAENDHKDKEFELSKAAHAYNAHRNKCREMLKEALWQGTPLDGIIDLLSYADTPEKTAQWLREDLRSLVDESPQWEFMMTKAASADFQGGVPNLDHPLLAEYNSRVLELGKVAQAKRAAEASAVDLEYFQVLSKAAEVWKEDAEKAQAILDTTASRLQYQEKVSSVAGSTALSGLGSGLVGTLGGGIARTIGGAGAGYAAAHAIGRPELAWEGAALGAGIGAGIRSADARQAREAAQRAAGKEITRFSNAFSSSRALAGGGIGLGAVLGVKGANHSTSQHSPVAHAYARNLQSQQPANWSQWS